MKTFTNALFIVFFVFSVSLRSENAPFTTIGVITNATTAPGAVVVPVTVKDFRSIGSFTLTMQYQTSQLTYVTATLNSAFPGMTINSSVPGKLIITWPQSNFGVTLPDETLLFDLTFTYISGNGALTWLYSGANVCQYEKFSAGSYFVLTDSPKVSYYINGGISSRGAPVTTVPVIINPPAGSLAVPVTVNDFTSVGAMSLSLEYDQNVLTYVSCVKNPAIGGGFNAGTNMGPNGKMLVTISWYGGASLPNGSTVVTINFTYSGTNGTWSALDWYENGSSCEYADLAGKPYYDLPTATYYQNGAVYTDYAPRVWLPVTTSAVPSGSVSLPAFIKNFNNVRSFNLSFEYDPAVMTYGSFTPDAEFGSALTATDNLSGSKRKIVMTWTGTENKTLPDGSLLGTVNFNYASGTTTLAWITNDLTSCRFNDANGKSYMDVPKTTHYKDGLIGSHVAPVAAVVHVSGTIGQPVTVPVKVYNYTNIGQFAYTLDYDPAVLTWQSGSLVPPLGGTFSADTSNRGRVLISWSGTAGSLADGSDLLNLNFLYNGGATTLAWFDDGNSCKYAENAGGPALYDLPQTTYYINGYAGPNPLAADFAAGSTYAATGGTISLNDQTTGGPTSWNWSLSPSTYYFTNGTSASSQNPQVKFTDDGVYAVTLIATKGTGSSIKIKKNYLFIGSRVFLTCPADQTVAACQSQAAVNNAYATWLASASTLCDCNCTLTNNSTGPPSACGGTATVTWTLTSDCSSPVTCTKTFTVTDAPAVVLDAPSAATEAACQTQAAINTKYTDWLADVSYSGGCNLSVASDAGAAPAACGGSITVTWTATSTCEANVVRSSTFTVNAAPAVVLTCASDLVTGACQTQAAINTAYANWLATTTFTGGCNAIFTNNSTGAPPACGGSVTVTWTVISDCEAEKTCSATFTVPYASAVVFNCGTDVTVPACQTQPQVDAAYAVFLSSTTASGGCNPVFTNNAPVTPPDICGGFTDVTWTYTSDCAMPFTCTKRFTVTSAPDVAFTCAVDKTEAPGQSQAAIDASFAAWLLTTTASGGCNGILTTNPATPLAPSATGGSITVTWTYTSSCAPLTTSCTKTFIVEEASPVIFNCATDINKAACQDQTAINTSFSVWLLTTTASGGCNGTLTTEPANPVAPSACGGSASVTWNYTSTCAPYTTSCTKTFSVDNAPAVAFTCGTDVTVPACQTQSQVDAAYIAFIASTTASGGCNGVLTNNGPTSAPPACGGFTDVTWTYTSDCEAPVTCTKRFTVTPAQAVVLTCATNLTTGACPTQADVNTAYANWLATTTFTGGCNAIFTNNDAGAPPACGGFTTVTWTVTSDCETEKTCSATFTVPDAPAVIFNCGTDVTVPACQTQAQVDAAYATFIASTTASGGCNGVFTNNAPLNAPAICGGFVDVTWTYTSDCASPVTCTKRFTVQAASAVALICATDLEVGACLTQTDVNAAYDNWLGTTIGFGGCNSVLTNNSTGAPSACGGSAMVTWTVTSDCGSPVECSATFTVPYAPAVIFTCGTDVTVPACQTQAQVNAAYAAFLGATTASSGCNGVLTNNAPLNAPSICGGYVDVTWTYSSDCASPVTCTKRFTVTAAPPVTITCATSQTTGACQTQAAVNTAYDSWLATTSFTGGCNSVLTNNSTGAPPACGGSRTVTWTVTSSCEPMRTCSATFTVTNAPAVTFTCGTSVTVPACQTQETVDAAYAAFVASTTASGGCNPVFTNNAPANAPSHCGGFVDVTWTYTSSCFVTRTCIRRFTVTAAPAVVFTCGTDVTVPACQTQAQVDAAYAAFVGSTTASGGCNGVFANDAPVNAPDICGGSVDVTWTYTSSCEVIQTCTRSFTVTPAPAVVLTCPADYIQEAGQPQATVDANYAAWVASVTVSGGCNATLSNNGAGAPPASGGSVTVTWTCNSDCEPLSTMCTAYFVVAPTYSLSGALKYNNLNESPMAGVTIRLEKLTVPRVNKTHLTLADGSYTFENLVAGTYTVKPEITKPEGDINSTDAAQVNAWGTTTGTIEYAQFLAGDVADNLWINGTDALKIQRHFVEGDPFDKGPWTYWKTGVMINSNWDPYTKPEDFDVVLSTANVVDFDLYAMCTGDFSGGYTPSMKATAFKIMLAYNDTRLAGAGEEVELPLRMVHAAAVGAVSLVLNFPAGLMEVTDVTMDNSGGELAWSVKGNELRIGWYALQPEWFDAGSNLVTIYLKTADSFGPGDVIRIEMAGNHLSELADGSFKTIPDATLGVSMLEYSTNGTVEPPARPTLTLAGSPNPFYEQTTLAYTLPAEGRVTLKINDMLGQTVLIPVNEKQSSGRHSVSLNGLSLQPGVYCATLTLTNSNLEIIKTIKVVKHR